MMNIPGVPQTKKLKTKEGVEKEITRVKNAIITCAIKYRRGYSIYLQELEIELEHNACRAAIRLLS
jgi:hypothetical protein